MGKCSQGEHLWVKDGSRIGGGKHWTATSLKQWPWPILQVVQGGSSEIAQIKARKTKLLYLYIKYALAVGCTQGRMHDLGWSESFQQKVITGERFSWELLANWGYGGFSLERRIWVAHHRMNQVYVYTYIFIHVYKCPET